MLETRRPSDNKTSHSLCFRHFEDDGPNGRPVRRCYYNNGTVQDEVYPIDEKWALLKVIAKIFKDRNTDSAPNPATSEAPAAANLK